MAEEKPVAKSNYEKLKELILLGDIEPNTRITETFIADRLKISRIPVREALQQLLYEGFIKRNSNKGYQITIYNEQDIIDLYYYREALDGMLVRLFTQRADPSQIYYLELIVQNLRKHVENFDLSALYRNDLEFHRTIARGAKNTHMEHPYEIVLEKVLYVSQMIIKSCETSIPEYHEIAQFNDIYSEHEEILKAVKEKDADGAEKAARKAIQTALKKNLTIFAIQHHLSQSENTPRS